MGVGLLASVVASVSGLRLGLGSLPTPPTCPPHSLTPAPPRPHPAADDVVRLGHHEHEAYYGDRTKEDLVAMADSLAQAAGQPHTFVHGVAKGAKSAGCTFSGAVVALCCCGLGWGALVGVRWGGGGVGGRCPALPAVF